MDETAIYDYSSVRIEQNIIEYISKFGSNWATGSRQDGFYVNFR
jgi:hypothetical protein